MLKDSLKQQSLHPMHERFPQGKLLSLCSLANGITKTLYLRKLKLNTGLKAIK